jgi:NAD(P)-dependent dehydrogenase (short-subunit alcohol dehydrogenase family)
MELLQLLEKFYNFFVFLLDFIFVEKIFLEEEPKELIIVDQSVIYSWAKTRGNNVVTRHLQESCQALHEFDKKTPLNKRGFPFHPHERFRCYGCGKLSKKNSPVYVFSCRRCGNKFQKYRHHSMDLSGKVALVIGGRTKLGHQVVVKLLQAGAIVFVTTRFPQKAVSLFENYSEWTTWSSQLFIYPEAFDLDISDVREIMNPLKKFIKEKGTGALDILICCAAQTIRVREKLKADNQTESNRYGDAKYVKEEYVNSWQMDFSDLLQHEMEEVYRINAIAPTIIIQQLIPLMKRSKGHPHIVNVHAREGLFEVAKNQKHIHTNMAKAGLAMLTKCLKSVKLKTHEGKGFSIHGCDPGWLSVDEYHESQSPWVVPPLDEIDGAARILFPVFKKKYLGSNMKTIRHFDILSY